MQLCCRLNTQRRKNDEHYNVPHKALNADSDAHSPLCDDGVSIIKRISDAYNDDSDAHRFFQKK